MSIASPSPVNHEELDLNAAREARAQLPAVVVSYDEWTSPTTNPCGVFAAFNLVLFCQTLSVLALLYLGKSPNQVYALLALTLALWVGVDVVLVKLWGKAKGGNAANATDGSATNATDGAGSVRLGGGGGGGGDVDGTKSKDE